MVNGKCLPSLLFGKGRMEWARCKIAVVVFGIAFIVDIENEWVVVGICKERIVVLWKNKI